MSVATQQLRTQSSNSRASLLKNSKRDSKNSKRRKNKHVLTISNTKKEAERLPFFEQEKEKFYEEVVFSDNAPDINTYKTYYESIDPENAEAIYKQVVTQLQEDAELKEYVDTYSNMKPKNAAAIFDSMTDNLELVCEILNAMDAASRADILAAMDEKNAAAVTAMMEP